MGLLSRLLRTSTSRTSRGATSSTPARSTAARKTAVTVVYRDRRHPAPLRGVDPEYGYAYLWPWPQKPQVGDWVLAPVGPNRELHEAVVVKLGRPQSAKGIRLKTLARRLPAPR